MATNAIDRREFLLASLSTGLAAGAALGAASGAASCSLGSTLLSVVSAPVGGAVPAAESCILIRLNGGIAQTDTWDPKAFTPFRRGMPARDLLGTCQSIPTALDGVRFGAGLEEMASVLDRGCLIRSIVEDPTATTSHRCGWQRFGWDLPASACPADETPESRLAWEGCAAEDAVSGNTFGGFAAQISAALRRVERGPARVMIDTPFTGFDGFDTHDHGAARIAELKSRIDAPIASLVRTLEARGLLERTLVIVASEFGRTVGTRHDAGDGPATETESSPSVITHESQYGFHAHFAGATCLLLFGGGMPRGRVIGRTAEVHPMVPIAEAVTVSDVRAMIAQALAGKNSPRPSGALAPLARPNLARPDLA